VARFLSAQATGGLKASTIGRRAAAIVFAHKLAGFEPPTSAETVRAVVRGIRHSIGTAPVRIRKKRSSLHALTARYKRPLYAGSGTLPGLVRSKSREFSRCSRFLPYIFARVGLPTQLGLCK